MRIVIDLQGAQTVYFLRDISRTALELSQAIVRNQGDHEVHIALNGSFQDTIEPIRAAFSGLIEQKNIHIWTAPGPVRECDPRNTLRREVAELIREAYLASLKPDIIYLSSLFDGFVDEAVTSIGEHTIGIPTIVMLDDLIPLLNREAYLLPNPSFEQHYLRKVSHLQRVDAYLISLAPTEVQGTVALDLEHSVVTNPSEACSQIFQKIKVERVNELTVRQQFGLTKPFAMYFGGYEILKNLSSLIHAYARLPIVIRSDHQLAIVGQLSADHRDKLRTLAGECDLHKADVIFTGYVTDHDLVTLYNLAKLVILPSLHEIFDLPVLEITQSGKPVIVTSTSSLPEAVAVSEAIFDPVDITALENKIRRAIEEQAAEICFVQHDQEEAKELVWNKNATVAISLFENIQKNRRVHERGCVRRLKLAVVSPLPPERTGIARYTAELLPALAHYYDITVVVEQKEVVDPWIQANCDIRDVNWFCCNHNAVDRILYHFGNSHFHAYMVDLLKIAPGVVVLHDFFLSGLQFHREIHGMTPHAWIRELYFAHGYKAVRERLNCSKSGPLISNVIMEYPANFSVLQQASGVIVHSEFSRALACHWYNKELSKYWKVIPHLRDVASERMREQTREKLGLVAERFVVCSFGLLGPTKQNHRLLKAWLKSNLAKDEQCMLIFVGENQSDNYGRDLMDMIRESNMQDRIQITGWADDDMFQEYLAAADVGVQLRTLSRGETSGTVLDCLNNGLPTIVNANGSIAEISSDAVWMLSDEFGESELVEAMERLYKNENLRAELSARARQYVRQHHSPRACAIQYRNAIEDIHLDAANGLQGLLTSISKRSQQQFCDSEYIEIAAAIAQNMPAIVPKRRLFLDMSATCRTDLKSGIERVARSVAGCLLNSVLEDYRVEPVYLCDMGGTWHYRYARRYTTLNLLGFPANEVTEGLINNFDHVVEPQSGDVLLGLDLYGLSVVQAERSGLYRRWRDAGVSVYFVVFDLLPVTIPEAFPLGADVEHDAWLRAVTKTDGAICISRTVAEELEAWLIVNGASRLRPYHIGWFHLGADVESSLPSMGMRDDAPNVLKQLGSRLTFLMVGTVEPRKRYMQALKAFTLLWEKGVDVNLVIVGNEGWKGVPEHMRRTIPETVACIQEHAELGNRLHWLKDISDEYLKQVYENSTCLIAASEDEGFCLPLIEAALHNICILARDIPIFREVAGVHAHYFSGMTPESLADGVEEWQKLKKAGLTPQSDMFHWFTWKQSTEKLLQVVLAGNWHSQWMPRA